MRREAAPIRDLQIRNPGTVLKHVLGADTKFVARLCRALIYKEAGAKAPASLNF